MRKLLYLILTVAFCATTGYAIGRVYKAPGNTPAYRIVGPADEARWANARFVPPQPLPPLRDPVMGEQFDPGDTYYDYWSNGSTGKMIVIDDAGGVHVTWMDGYSNENQGTRQQKYNYYNGEVWLEEDGVQVPPGTRSGYGTIDMNFGDDQRAVIANHAVGILEGADPTSVVCIDFALGWGAFQPYGLPNLAETRIIWPQVVLSPSNKLHVVYNVSGANSLHYTSADWNGGEPNFPEVPIGITPTSLNTYRIAAAPDSERVAITWISARTGIPAPPEWDGFLAYQMNNDLWVATSEDGEDWNFEDPLNVTRIIPTNPDVEGDESYGDTLRPITTHDVMFDHDGYMHIIFEARGLWEKAIYDPEVDRPPVDGLTLDASFLYHWSEETDSITPVADGWFTQQVRDENDSLLLWPKPGAWKSNVCQPSMALAGNGDIYCVYNYYPPDDYNNYVDGEGRCHGDIAVTVSQDGGATWFYPTYITTTSSPLADVGEAMCEVYPTVSKVVEDYLEIFYLLDREAGSVVQDDPASNTLNPVYYLRVPIAEVLTDSIWHGPAFHVPRPNQVRDTNPWTPDGFRLTGAYPNPFNQSTVVEFDVQSKQIIDLALYGLDGRLIKNLYSGEVLSGHHRVTLDGRDLAAGLYFVKLKGSQSESVMKVTYLR